MSIPTLFVFFIIVSIYILEPEAFRLLPEALNLGAKIWYIELRLYFMKRRLKRELLKSMKRMEKDREEFINKTRGIK